MMITVCGGGVGVGISVAFWNETGLEWIGRPGVAGLGWDGTSLGLDGVEWDGLGGWFCCLGFACLVLYYTTKRAVYGLRMRCEDRAFLVHEVTIPAVAMRKYLVQQCALSLRHRVIRLSHMAARLPSTCGVAAIPLLTKTGFLRTIFISCATQPSGLPFASPSPSSLPEAFSFRRSFTSQLYTRAVATSIVCSVISTHVQEAPQHYKGFDAYRDLLPQEIQILVAVLERRLRGVEFRPQEGFGFGEGVGEHYIRL